MTGLRRRLSEVVAWTGEAFSVGGVARRGIFAVVTPGEARVYVPDGELDLFVRPTWGVLVPHDDPTAVAAIVTWNGGAYTVRRAQDLRVRGMKVARWLLISG